MVKSFGWRGLRWCEAQDGVVSLIAASMLSLLRLHDEPTLSADSARWTQLHGGDGEINAQVVENWLPPLATVTPTTRKGAR